jgi:hypothetical protein
MPLCETSDKSKKTEENLHLNFPNHRDILDKFKIDKNQAAKIENVGQ